MSGFANDMTLLLNKLERRLGLLPITPHLPKEFGKEVWAEQVIMEDALISFSRYFGYCVSYLVDEQLTPKDDEGYFLINEEDVGGLKILGCMDLDWSDFTNNSLSMGQLLGYGVPDIGAMNYGYEDILGFQMRADYASIFRNNIYIDYKYPNRFKLKGIGNVDVKLITRYKVKLLVQHPGLHTIAPTKMETFEALCQACLAEFLYNNLKYYEGTDTVFAQTDMRLTDLQTEAQKKEDIMNQIKESYISAGNSVIPLIMAI